MAKLNPKPIDYRIDKNSQKLAGGYGRFAAKQDLESLLRRAVMANLLWENVAYESGDSIANHISTLIPRIPADVVANIAIESRIKQKLRHIPLFMIVEMAKYNDHKKLIRKVINQVITRPDQMTDLLGLYWKDGKKPIPAQMKLGLADCFAKFSEYQFAKYDRKTSVKFRDIMRMVHPKPTRELSKLYNKIINQNLDTPDTWEVALSSGADKNQSWTRLIHEDKLPDMAFLKNLRNIISAGVSEKIIRNRFDKIKSSFLLPLNFLSAKKYAPNFQDEIEKSMFNCYGKLPKLPGFTIFVVDVSGSMNSTISSKSELTRKDAAIAMAILAREQCESCAIYATAGNDSDRIHSTQRIPNSRGFNLEDKILSIERKLGGGGIFTRQCLDFIRNDIGNTEQVDRIIIFSDSQDCDHESKRIPNPFGTYNYIIDVSANKHGINYDGIWTAEVSGWSEHFLTYISGMEGLNITEENELFSDVRGTQQNEIGILQS